MNAHTQRGMGLALILSHPDPHWPVYSLHRVCAKLTMLDTNAGNGQGCGDRGHDKGFFPLWHQNDGDTT